MTAASGAATRAGAGRPGPRRSRRSRRRRRTAWTLLWLIGAMVVFVVTVGAGLLAAPVDFTPPAPPRPALIVDRNGKLLGEILAPEQRTEIPANQIPTVMRNAVVAAEDKRFYDSSGVDPIAIVRAAISDVHGNPTQGGSTITQQYVKNVFVGDQRSYTRKLKEAALAIRLEQRLSKDEILTRYLNVVYFGNDAYGVEAASEYYFGIHAKDLDLSQASMLAGLLPAPSTYNPVASLSLARQRQMYVLDRMVDSGYTDAATASDAYDAIPAIVKHTAMAATSGVAPEFTAEVASQIKDEYENDPDTLYRAGLKVQTTLDVNWQQAATAALQQVLPAADDPEASVVVVDYQTGDLLALANKTDKGYAESDPAELAYRTSGSTIKPFTLATALENGDTLDTYEYGPSSKTYPAGSVNQGCRVGGTKPYVIKNDEGGGGGYSLKSALAYSVNTVYGPLAISLGTSKVAAVAKAAGMTDRTGTTDSIDCSMGLGVNVTPLKEAYAYAALADHGVKLTPRKVLSVSDGVTSTGTGGQVISKTPAATATPAIPGPVADQVVEAMRGVVAFGTATAAQQPDGIDVFGKTGTTDDETDAWFTGCLPAYTVCVTTWMGYRNTFNADGSPHSMLDVEGVGEVFGGTLPAKIFATTAQGYRDRAKPVVAPTTSAAPTPTRTRIAPRTTFVPPPTTPASTPATRRTTSASAPPTTSAPQTSISAPPTSVSAPPTTPAGPGGPGIP